MGAPLALRAYPLDILWPCDCYLVRIPFELQFEGRLKSSKFKFEATLVTLLSSSLIILHRRVFQAVLSARATAGSRSDELFGIVAWQVGFRDSDSVVEVPADQQEARERSLSETSQRSGGAVASSSACKCVHAFDYSDIFYSNLMRRDVSACMSRMHVCACVFLSVHEYAQNYV